MNRVLASLLFVFIAFLAALPALASNPINFNGTLNDREKLLVDGYIKQVLTPDQIARVDLNEDGLSEYIIRTGCANLCTFKVLAESSDKIVDLGDIKARSLELGNSYSASVRNIIAFQTDGNDYERTVYVWEPKAARYMIKQE